MAFVDGVYFSLRHRLIGAENLGYEIEKRKDQRGPTGGPRDDLLDLWARTDAAGVHL